MLPTMHAGRQRCPRGGVEKEGRTPIVLLVHHGDTAGPSLVMMMLLLL